MSQGGLHIPGPLGIGETQEETIQRTWSTFDEMELHLARNYGVHPLEQPRCAIPRITGHLLNDANNREFSQIYANFGEWFGYITSLYGRIQAKIVEINNEMSDLEVHNRKEMLNAWRQTGGVKKDKPTVQEMSDYNALHPRHRELQLDHQRWEQQRLILQPRKEQLKKDSDIVSRQVTIRGQEIERNRLGGNMAGRRFQPRGSE